MDSDSECAAAAIVVAVLLKRRKRSKHKKRSAWVKPWLQKRTQFGIYDTLLQELRLQEEEDYKKFLRMSTDTFDELLQLISNDIQKQDTVMRASIPPKIKLAATIRFLSTGANYADLQYQFRIHKSTLTHIIPEVCEAIYKRLKDNFLKVSNSFHSHNQSVQLCRKVIIIVLCGG